MILTDAGVWIDYLHERDTAHTQMLDRLLEREDHAVADLTITEVLQGIRRDEDRQFETIRRLFEALPLVVTGGRPLAEQAARNYRHLRGLGITVRSTIDTLIATRCIMDGHALLFSDRDFGPFVEHLGLRAATS